MSSQKYLGRNRSPRVQIEYDLELYGVEKKVQLPFVMGVLADLRGNASQPPAPLAERQFLEVDAGSLDQRMKALQPRISVAVQDTLRGHGKLQTEMVFERLEDFSPGAVARKVAPLRALLEARERLSDLVTYSDGKAGAEQLLAGLLELAHRARNERHRELAAAEPPRAARTAEEAADANAAPRARADAPASQAEPAAQARGAGAEPAAGATEAASGGAEPTTRAQVAARPGPAGADGRQP